VERNLDPVVKNRTPEVFAMGKNFPLPALDALPFSALEVCEGFASLTELNAALHARTKNNIRVDGLSEPLEIEDLEMLEAELENQGILPVLPSSCCSLSQLAYHEGNTWRWLARRTGYEGLEFKIYISVPEYIISRLHEVAPHIEKFGSASNDNPLLFERRTIRHKTIGPQESLLAELSYLDRFALYLMGGFEATSNRYQQGLNVVLKVLAARARRVAETTITAEQHRSEPIALCLPLSRPEFFRLLKTSARPRSAPGLAQDFRLRHQENPSK